MVRLWRVTRNRYGRAVYDALAAIGVTGTVMYEYSRPLDGTIQRDRDSPDGQFTIRRPSPERIAPIDAPVDELHPEEEIVAAFADDVPLGYLFLSIDATLEIDPLGRTLQFEGAYVRRVFVAPDHRNRGVATAMLTAACRRAAELGAKRATALVALDNTPSRRLFERCGFEPRRVRRYVRVGPLSHRSVSPT